MDIGTAKPTLAERPGVPHHLLDLVEPDAAFSVADFVRAAEPVLAGLAGRGGVALLVGGTGLWLRAAGDRPRRRRLAGRRRAAGAARGASSTADGRRGAGRAAPGRGAAHRRRAPTCATRAGSSGRSRSPGCGATGRRPAPRGYGGRVLRLNLTLDPERNRAWIERRATGQLDGRPARRGGPPPPALRLRPARRSARSATRRPSTCSTGGSTGPASWP